MSSARHVDDIDAYFKKIECELKPINHLSVEEQLSYLETLFRHHIQAYAFHNFELRDASHSHPLYRMPLTLFHMGNFIKGYNGGFCFQSSQILYSALIAAGFAVDCSIAKVLNGLSPDSDAAKKIPATHLILIVNIEDKRYLLDPSMGMHGHCSPFLISASDSTYQQNNHHFKLEKRNDQFLFYREVNSQWSLTFCSSLAPANIKMITTQLTKLGCYPDILGIRDIITLVGIGTPTGGKSLLWNPKNKTFTFKIISSQESDKEETFEDVNRAYHLLGNDFNIEHVSKLQFKQYCGENHWPKSKRSLDVNFPIDHHEISRMKKMF